jgi:hypothetical protein
LPVNRKTGGGVQSRTIRAGNIAQWQSACLAYVVWV